MNISKVTENLPCELAPIGERHQAVYLLEYGYGEVANTTERTFWLCEKHALAMVTQQALAPLPQALSKNIRFYLEFHDKTAKGRASHEKTFLGKLVHSDMNVVAVFLNEERQPIIESYTPVTFAAYTSVLFQDNSPVNFSSVGRDYLAENCLRISHREAAMVRHTELWQRILSDADQK